MATPRPSTTRRRGVSAGSRSSRTAGGRLLAELKGREGGGYELWPTGGTATGATSAQMTSTSTSRRARRPPGTRPRCAIRPAPRAARVPPGHRGHARARWPRRHRPPRRTAATGAAWLEHSHHPAADLPPEADRPIPRPAPVSIGFGRPPAQARVELGGTGEIPGVKLQVHDGLGRIGSPLIRNDRTRSGYSSAAMTEKCVFRTGCEA